MLAIRMQRTGRKGHAQFRVIVQDAHRHPSSGNIVASIGHYDPHTKATQLEKDKASFYLEHGAQPSDRVARLLKSEGVKLPKWVELAPKKKSAIKHPEKLRKNRPAGVEAPPTKEEKLEAAAEEKVAEAEAAPATDTDETTEVTETPAAEAPTTEVAEKAPAEATPAEAAPEPAATDAKPEPEAEKVPEDSDTPDSPAA